MGDMGEFYRDRQEHKKRKRHDRMYEFETKWKSLFPGLVEFTPHHYRLMVADRNLDWWPSTAKWLYLGHMYHGGPEQLHGFVRNRGGVAL